MNLSQKAGKEYVTWHLTELVKKWYIEGTDNTTIALAMTNEDEIGTYTYYASATFYAYAGSIPPILTVSYRNNTGIEPYYTYATLGAGEAGTAYISDHTGQLKIAKKLVSYAYLPGSQRNGIPGPRRRPDLRKQR